MCLSITCCHPLFHCPASWSCRLQNLLSTLASFDKSHWKPPVPCFCLFRETSLQHIFYSKISCFHPLFDMVNPASYSCRNICFLFLDFPFKFLCLSLCCLKNSELLPIVLFGNPFHRLFYVAISFLYSIFYMVNCCLYPIFHVISCCLFTIFHGVI